VLGELGEGADGGAAGAGGDAVACEDGGGLAGGLADAGGAGAEEPGEEGVADAGGVVGGGGGDDGVERDEERALRAGRPAAGAAAAEVQALLAGGLQGDGDLAEQGGQVGDAGQGGERGRHRGIRAGGLRLWLRSGPGSRRDRVVPLAVEGIPADDAVFQVPDALAADLHPVGVVAVVEDGGALQALSGDGGGDAGDGVLPGRQGPGAPGAGDVAEQPVLYLVPLAGAGREVSLFN
jgi:hypothetical protein